MSLITDLNAAFHGNKNHINRLEKTFQKIAGNVLLEDVLSAKAEPDWQKKLARYKR